MELGEDGGTDLDWTRDLLVHYELPGRLIARYHPGKIPMELVEPHFDKILTGLDGNKSDEDHDEVSSTWWIKYCKYVMSNTSKSL